MNAEGISEFLAVARTGSFTAAARALGVSVPHVSRQVRRLETRLDVKLFQRSTRSVRLTDPGEALRSDCEGIAQDLDRALEAARSDRQALTGRLRITAPTGSFEAQFLADAMTAFALAHPGIELDMDYSPRRVDIVREGFDLAIRSDAGHSAGLSCHPLIERQRVAAASPDYLDRFGVPQCPADLQNHSCIKTQSNSWAFTENGRRRDVPVHGRLRFNSGPTIRAAAEAGLGIAYMVRDGFDDAVTSGRLIPVLEPFWRAEASLHLIHPEMKPAPRRLTMLIEHLQGWADQHAKTF